MLAHNLEGGTVLEVVMDVEEFEEALMIDPDQESVEVG